MHGHMDNATLECFCGPRVDAYSETQHFSDFTALVAGILAVLPLCAVNWMICNRMRQLSSPLARAVRARPVGVEDVEMTAAQPGPLAA